MPLYEYQCKKCRETTEVLQKAKDKPLEKCPRCGGAVVKLISSPAIQFKGSGFYKTDYPSSSAGSGSSGGDSTSSESKGSESKGSESKSDKSGSE